MKRNILNLSFLILVVAFFTACSSPQERETSLFNENWKFSKGETGSEKEVAFDDAGWRNLDLPHDWAIEGPFDKEHDTRTGGLPIYGTAWYRKDFNMDAAHNGKTVTLTFDGVMNNAEVFVNGQKAGERPFGYISFD